MAAEPESKPRVSRRSGALPLRGLHVLVVDDEPDSLELLALALEHYGAATSSASSVREALAELDRAEFDLVLSDIGMPEEDGYMLARALRAHPQEHWARRVPALAVTAFARAEDRRAALAAGFTMHLAKPVDPSDLVNTVKQLTGRV